MPSIFAKAWGRAAANIDTYFGEDFTYQPMSHAGGRYAADITRPPTDITAACYQVPVFSALVGKRTASNTVAEVSSSHIIIDLARGALPYAWKGKDRLTRTDTGEIFEINGLLDDELLRDDTRLKLRVQRLQGPA